MLWWLLGFWLISPALIPIFWMLGRLTQVRELDFRTDRPSRTTIDGPKPWFDWLIVTLGGATLVLEATTVLR
jgi:hypothetical protein